jgi:hypothetical protein
MQDRTDIVARLRAVDHMSVEDCFLQSHLLSAAADEIGRLRAIIRVNALRAGGTHAQIDTVVFPSPPSPTGGGPIHD